MSLDSSNNLSQTESPAQIQCSRSNPNSHSGFNSLAVAAAALSKQNESSDSLDASNNQSAKASSLKISSSLARGSCSGVDKLLLAAMVEESSSSSADASATRPFSSASGTITPASSATTNHLSSQNQMAMSMSHLFAQPSQQQMFLAPTAQAPYIPMGRGIGSPAYTSSMLTTRDSLLNIPTPRNKSELELYKLLEKANLLNYFGTFLSCGGDDVQQLSDADEEEFLEIMTLIGMTQKPLHVRRLQRALYEWRESCGELFDSPYKRPNPIPPNNYHFISRHSHQQSAHHPPSGHYQYSSHLNHLGGHRHSNPDNERNQSRSCTTIMVESPAPTPNSIASSAALTSTDPNSSMQPQYNSPHEVLIGAPKRPRLMDSIKPRDLTKLITVDDLDEDEKLAEAKHL